MRALPIKPTGSISFQLITDPGSCHVALCVSVCLNGWYPPFVPMISTWLETNIPLVHMPKLCGNNAQQKGWSNLFWIIQHRVCCKAGPSTSSQTAYITHEKCMRTALILADIRSEWASFMRRPTRTENMKNFEIYFELSWERLWRNAIERKFFSNKSDTVWENSLAVIKNKLQWTRTGIFFVLCNFSIYCKSTVARIENSMRSFRLLRTAVILRNSWRYQKMLQHICAIAEH